MPHTRETHPEGRWVQAADVSPETNVANREARFESGLITNKWEHVSGLSGPVTHWWFADHKEEGE
jgi:hypothetical protein